MISIKSRLRLFCARAELRSNYLPLRKVRILSAAFLLYRTNFPITQNTPPKSAGYSLTWTRILIRCIYDMTFYSSYLIITGSKLLLILLHTVCNYPHLLHSNSYGWSQPHGSNHPKTSHIRYIVPVTSPVTITTIHKNHLHLS